LATQSEIDAVVSKYPCEEVSIEITERCDMKCIHCSSEATKEGWKNELSFVEIESIIHAAKNKLGTKVISLSGGDPIIREDFVDIVKMVDELDLNVLVYSSGGLFPDSEMRMMEHNLMPFHMSKQYEDIKNIMRKKGNKMIYSLEGGNQFTHEFVTRRHGSWACTKDSIMKTAMDNIYTEVHTCPMTVNLNELSNMYEILIQLGVDRWSFLRLVPQGRCSEYDWLITDEREFKHLLKILAALMVKSKLDSRTKMDIRIGDPLNFYACMHRNSTDHLYVYPF
jgi:AdoMet-dependent heme synthase